MKKTSIKLHKVQSVYDSFTMLILNINKNIFNLKTQHQHKVIRQSTIFAHKYAKAKTNTTSIFSTR